MENQQITIVSEAIGLQAIGKIANQHAASHAFDQYQQRLDPNTLERQKYDLAVFALYLDEIDISPPAELLYTSPTAWEGMTHGLLRGFVQWMLRDGYAVGSVNVRLSTVKTYVKLAAQAGVISEGELALIEHVKGYRYAEGENVDSQRSQTRKGAKKAQPVLLTPQQMKDLKLHPDTPQGRRDTLLMCLLLDHGLRCGEVADLIPGNIHLSEGLMVFKREKVKMVQRHRLTADTLLAFIRYFEVCQPEGNLLVGSRKGKAGDCLKGGMSRRAITKRVHALGVRTGILNLSAHDCRHAWVEAAIRGKTDIKTLQDAGGWSSPAMPLRYAAAAEIANEGVRLG